METHLDKRIAAIAFGVALISAAACTASPAATAGPTGGSAATTGLIPQPDVKGVQVAPTAARVDLRVPTFSHPTEITNRLFPVSDQASVLMLGHVDGEPFRTEVTLLPDTEVVRWAGTDVEVVVSQYVAYRGGKIDEVAYDRYAQADDGSVWYFGEDVFDFRDGGIVVTEGTWLAGRDGPPAMIMPGRPAVGDVYRTENAPPFVFEQVTVGSVSEQLRGPFGSVTGMRAEELHLDGSSEDKLFAPGYGEFRTAGGGDLEALALAVPTDVASGPMPEELSRVTDAALAIVDAAGANDWATATGRLDALTSSWEAVSPSDVPRLVAPVMTRAVADLSAAVRAGSSMRAQVAAIEVARSGFDLQLRYRPVAEIDLARMDLWAAQLLIDHAAGDRDAVGDDQFAIDYVRDRLLGALSTTDLGRLSEKVTEIQLGVVDGDLGAAARAARELRAMIPELHVVST
jgi:hypothetical protein